MSTSMRQIPSSKEYVSNKGYNDLLYGYLQSISSYDDETTVRYINKSDVKFTKIAEQLGLHRQTVSARFKTLQETHLIEYNEVLKRYEIVKLSQELATLLPTTTIRILCNTLKERSLSILAYLIKWGYAHENMPCDINIDLMKDYLGLNVTNRGTNNEIIVDTLILLKQLGILDFHIEHRIDEKTQGLKKYYVLDKLNNGIDWDFDRII